MENEHELSYETLTRVYLRSYENYKSVGPEVELLEPGFELDDQEWVEIGTFSFERLWGELYRLETSMEDVEGCLWCRDLYGAKGKDVAIFRTKKWIVVLVRKAARTMLIFSRAPLAEAIATACFTQNRSIIHRRFNKTPYELINERKLNISFLHVFGALCYPKNDREDIMKLGAKETMNVSFDELSAMAFEQRSLKPGLNSMTSGHISSGLDLTYASSTITTQQPSEDELDLLFKAMYDDYIGGQPSASTRTVSPAQEPQVRQSSTASTTIADTIPMPTNSSSHATNIPITS
nr:hypothetical protein [Tanacetum cinerariifolium]